MGNTDQENCEYRHFTSSVILDNRIAHVCSHGQSDTEKNHDIRVANVSAQNKKGSFTYEMEWAPCDFLMFSGVS